jgi:hypothetical protein
MLSALETRDKGLSSGSNLHALFKHHVEKKMLFAISEIPKISSLSNDNSIVLCQMKKMW